MEKLIHAGLAAEAKLLLKKTIKQNNLNSWDIIFASKLYSWLSEPSEALGLLGKPLNADALWTASPVELCVQITLAQMLAFTGAVHLAAQIFHDVERVTVKRKIDFFEIFPQYYRTLADFRLNRGDYLEAQSYFNKVCEIYHSSTRQYRFAAIGIADCLDGAGYTEEALLKLDLLQRELKTEDRAFAAIVAQARGEYLFRAQRWVEARHEVERSRTLFGEKSTTKDFAYLEKWSGALSIQEGQFSTAQRELEESLQILTQPHSQPLAALQVIYWMEQVPGLHVPNGLRTALRCHPCFSHYAWLVGSARIGYGLRPHPWISARRPAEAVQAWEVSADDIRPVEPSLWLRQAWSGDLYPDWLDLRAGLRKKSDIVQVLTEVQIRLLTCLIGAGSLGEHEWVLIESIYGQEFADFESARERLKSLVREIRVQGFQVIRRKNFYFYEFDRQSVLIPSDLCSRGPTVLLGIIRPHFTRREVEQIFKISSRTANSWIEEWLRKGLVGRNEDFRALKYVVIE